jgi:uncharacterized membrane protein
VGCAADGNHAAGHGTLLLGLVVAVPWLAHASWHAYRDLVPLADLAEAP